MSLSDQSCSTTLIAPMKFSIMSSNCTCPSTAFRQWSGAMLSLILLSTPMSTPTAALAHGGHGNEFQGGDHAAQSTDGIQVDADVVERIGLKVEPVARQRLAIGIQATGQIETSPSRQVEVTNPVGGTVVKLFVQPGDTVQQGQALAVITSAELAELRVEALDRRAETAGTVQEAQTNLLLAQQNYQQQQRIAQTAIDQAQTELRIAQEQYDRDQELSQQGALPRRQVLESEARLATAHKALAEAESRLQVLEASADLKRAQTAVEVAQDRAALSTATYSTRLKQLGTQANPDGTITITAPIAGRIADREVTLGQSAEDAGAPLMTIVDDRTVLATANIYEKDLNQVAIGQPVRVTVVGFPERSFQGRVTVVGAVVEGETRVVPVKAEIDNLDSALKPGMFAELEVITDRTAESTLAIPRSAVVEVNGKQTVYVQNGNAYQPVEVRLGRIAGDWVEVQNGLFEGDMIVTQRTAQLYAQSLRGGSAKPETEAEVETNAKTNTLPWWMLALGGSAIAASTFAAGTWWASRRARQSLYLDLSRYNGLKANPSALAAEPVEKHETSHESH